MFCVVLRGGKGFKFHYKCTKSANLGPHLNLYPRFHRVYAGTHHYRMERNANLSYNGLDSRQIAAAHFVDKKRTALSAVCMVAWWMHSAAVGLASLSAVRHIHVNQSFILKPIAACFCRWRLFHIITKLWRRWKRSHEQSSHDWILDMR